MRQVLFNPKLWNKIAYNIMGRINTYSTSPITFFDALSIEGLLLLSLIPAIVYLLLSKVYPPVTISATAITFNMGHPILPIDCLSPPKVSLSDQPYDRFIGYQQYYAIYKLRSPQKSRLDF